ncbi:MAG: SDR family NAD(P)-dependent oxidoreductase [Candidatus Helarchaeota archaeon]
MTEWDFENKIVVITGGGSGIGEHAAKEFAKYKATTIIFDISDENGNKVIEDIKNNNGIGEFFKVDITNQDEIKDIAKQIYEKYGKIDILVNCAGKQDAPTEFLRTKKKSWDIEIGVNFYGVLICTQAILKYMKKKKYGRIISISSDAGKVGEPLLAVYSGAKGAIQSFSKALAKEVGKFGITVNVICPGTTETPMTAPLFKSPEIISKMVKRYPMRRLGKPNDIVNGILFLASDESSWITGQVISISGGYST